MQTDINCIDTSPHLNPPFKATENTKHT